MSNLLMAVALCLFALFIFMFGWLVGACYMVDIVNIRQNELCQVIVKHNIQSPSYCKKEK